MTERELHISVVDQLLGPLDSNNNRVRTAGRLPEIAALHHSPNAGRRGWHSQRDLKSHGTQAGWPDLEVLHLGMVIFIELKSPRGKPTAIQKDCHRRLREAGFPVHVCRSPEEVMTVLELEGIPLRARLKGKAA